MRKLDQENSDKKSKYLKNSTISKHDSSRYEIKPQNQKKKPPRKTREKQ